MAERVVERAVALRLAREVLVGLEVAPADLMAVADWLLSGRAAQTESAANGWIRDRFLNVLPAAEEVAGD